jgi:hypothetical protein
MLILKSILLLFTISTIASKDHGVSYLTISDGDRLISKYNIFITRPPKNKNYSFKAEGKICIVNSKENLDDCWKYNDIYNSNWILLIKDKQVNDWIHSWETANWDNIENKILAHILHENIKTTEFYEGITSFWMPNDDFYALYKFDVRNEKSNYFISLVCKYNVLKILVDNISKIFPYTYLYWTSLSTMIVSFGVIALWHVSVYRIYFANITTLQKVLTVLPFMKFLLSLLVFYYISITKEGIIYTLTKMIIKRIP